MGSHRDGAVWPAGVGAVGCRGEMGFLCSSEGLSTSQHLITQSCLDETVRNDCF